jgi:hypothetical protein
MTPKNHQLMVFMFARQFMMVNSLIEILKNRGVLDDSDVEAFEELTRATETSQMDSFHAVVSQYSKFAEQLGISGELPPA